MSSYSVNSCAKDFSSFKKGAMNSTMVETNDFRCNTCCKLLAKANSQGMIAGEIKCPRCKEVNAI